MGNSSRRRFLQLAGGATLSGLSGCQSILKSNQDISMGALLPLTGALEKYGQGMEQAIRIAQREINATGGPLDTELTVEILDTKTGSITAIDAYRKLVEDHGSKWIIGPAEDRIAVQIAKEAASDSVVLLSPSCSDPRLANIGFESEDRTSLKFVGRTGPNMAQQGVTMGLTMNKYLGVATVALLVPGERERYVAKQASKVFGGRTLRIVEYELHPDRETLDTLFQDQPEAIGYVDYHRPAKETFNIWKEAGYDGQWVLTNSVLNRSMMSSISDVLEGMYLVKPNRRKTAGGKIFRQQFEGEISEFSPHAYDAVYLIAMAIHRSGEANPTETARNLQAVSQPPGEMVSVGEFQRAKSIIQENRELNFNGASSNLDLTTRLEPLYRNEITQVRSSGLKSLEMIPPAFYTDKLYS